MKTLIRAIAAGIAVGMLMLATVGLSPWLVGMMAFAILALVAKGHMASAARDGPRHKKSLFYHDQFGVQFQRSDFAMAPMSRSYAGMGPICRSVKMIARRIHDGCARRLAGLNAKIKTMYRMYNARDSGGYRTVVQASLHGRESLALGYH